MADYVLSDGMATKIRESAGDEEGYVDLDMAEADGALTPVLGTDLMLVQRGASDPQTATLTVLTALVADGLQTELDDADWLNNGYLY